MPRDRVAGSACDARGWGRAVLPLAAGASSVVLSRLRSWVSLGLLALRYNPPRNILVHSAACQCGGATASLLPSPPGLVSHIGCCWMSIRWWWCMWSFYRETRLRLAGSRVTCLSSYRLFAAELDLIRQGTARVLNTVGWTLLVHTLPAFPPDFHLCSCWYSPTLHLTHLLAFCDLPPSVSGWTGCISCFTSPSTHCFTVVLSL